MKKNSIIFLMACLVFLNLAGFVLADWTGCVGTDCTSAPPTGPIPPISPPPPPAGFGVSIPNPLCLPGSATCVNDFPTLIKDITAYISGVIGSLAVIIFIWAGILFVTSSGNEAQLGKAKKALLYAVVGSAIALAGAGLVAVIQAVIPVP